MDVAQLILDFIKTLIWPLMLIVSVFLFRPSISALILRLRSAKVAGAEAEFEVKVENAAHQIEDARSKLTEPRASGFKSATRGHRDMQTVKDNDEEAGENPETGRADPYESATIVPNLGNVITHSELSRIRHPSRGTFLSTVSETIIAIGLPRTPHFKSLPRRRSNWQLDVADLWHELDRYLDGLCYSIVVALSKEVLNEYTGGRLKEAVELYRSGNLDADVLLDQLGRYLSLRSVSAISLGVAKLHEIERDMRSIHEAEPSSDIVLKYRASCEGVVDVLDTVFRYAGTLPSVDTE